MLSLLYEVPVFFDWTHMYLQIYVIRSIFILVCPQQTSDATQNNQCLVNQLKLIFLTHDVSFPGFKNYIYIPIKSSEKSTLLICCMSYKLSITCGILNKRQITLLMFFGFIFMWLFIWCHVSGMCVHLFLLSHSVRGLGIRLFMPEQA